VHCLADHRDRLLESRASFPTTRRADACSGDERRGFDDRPFRVVGGLGEAGQYLAQSEGYFAHEGLDIDFFKSDPAHLFTTMLTGGVDVFGGPVDPALEAAVQRILFAAPEQHFGPTTRSAKAFAKHSHRVRALKHGDSAAKGLIRKRISSLKEESSHA